nr:retrovirus-related Pol polyprotein from transposon TNT 1-94 [Tanacetum cinerariifolium]
MHDEFEMNMIWELNFFLGLQIKQIEDGIFFNQPKYIKEMLKKFELEDFKPAKTPMSMENKLTKDDEADSMDSVKYRVKLCLENEVKDGDKIVKKELIVALRGEIYFVKSIINPEEDDIEPGVSLRRSFLRLTKDDWELLLDGINFGYIPKLKETSLPPFVCKMGKALGTRKGIDEAKPMNRGIILLNHSKAEPIGVLKDVLCQVGVTTIIAMFLILDILWTKRICHQKFHAAKTNVITKESDSRDDDDYCIKRNSMGHQFMDLNLLDI